MRASIKWDLINCWHSIAFYIILTRQKSHNSGPTNFINSRRPSLAKSSATKKKQKQKARQKKARTARSQTAAREKGEILADQAAEYIDTGHVDKAVAVIKKAVKRLPADEYLLNLMGHIGSVADNRDMELEAMAGLERLGKLPDEHKIRRLHLLVEKDRFQECLDCTEKLLARFSTLTVKSKAKVQKEVKGVRDYCLFKLEEEKWHKDFKAAVDVDLTLSGQKKQMEKQPPNRKKQTETPSNIRKAAEEKPIVVAPVVAPLPEIPVQFDLDQASFYDAFLTPEPAGPELYDLALESHAIRFKESFETLVCLSSLFQVRRYWYQEETAKKVLKRFRGRALLSDEVGLGKTIEALMVFSEYVKRGMVKTGLILTPTPLVSQWKEELKSKFGLDIPSTDDPDFKSRKDTFWEAPFILASINQAKSKKNFAAVTAREYDMVIVDEAHHLKNKTTLNWKLVNALKKRFILLLTATPVENNLMELYNLITLLKPGQLETATAFREKFMKRGDPTDPRNRALLKELLGEVMIRNTRALAGINIPPRFAQTIRIEASAQDIAFYERIEALIMDIHSKSKGRGRLIAKNLLAQAGSSPTAVGLSISRMLTKKDYLWEHEQALLAVKNLCRTTLDTPKNKALLKLIRSSEEKMIIFVKYRGTLDHIAEFLEWHHIPAARFHGGMDNRQKDLEIEAFRDQKNVLITTEIGGEGRNLQFCCRMVNYDLPWNPMKIEQRIGRIHRIGQEKEVQIFNFCAAGSIEDYILDILDRKINMFEMVIGEIDMIIGRIRGEKEFEEMVYDIWVEAATEEDRKKTFDNLGVRLKRARTGYQKTRELDDKLFGDTYEL